MNEVYMKIDGKMVPLMLAIGDGADFVVEQGTSGNWTYRKWNSGYAEVDYRVDISNVKINNSSGQIYYGDIYTQSQLPITFKEVPCCSISCSFSNTNAWVWLAGKLTTTTFPNCYVARGTSLGTTSTTATFSAHITGYWK